MQKCDPPAPLQRDESRKKSPGKKKLPKKSPRKKKGKKPRIKSPRKKNPRKKSPKSFYTQNLAKYKFLATESSFFSVNPVA
jgi:hypothetical protein